MTIKTTADERERLINQRVMGGCNHPDYVLERDREAPRLESVVCTACGLRTLYHRAFMTGDVDPDPLAVLQKTIPLHCADVVNRPGFPGDSIS